MATLLVIGSANAQNNKEKKEKKISKVGSFLKKTVESTTGLNVSDEVYITMESGEHKNKIDLDCRLLWRQSYRRSLYGNNLQNENRQNKSLYLSTQCSHI